jgi:hypothetical protein
MQGFPLFCGVRKVLSQNGVLAETEMFPTAEARRRGEETTSTSGMQERKGSYSTMMIKLLSCFPGFLLKKWGLRDSASPRFNRFLAASCEYRFSAGPIGFWLELDRNETAR